MASNVDIAEDARFKFQIIQPVLNHVAYADNASQLAVHRHVAHPMARHQAHQVGEIIPKGCGNQAVRHDVLYLHRRVTSNDVILGIISERDIVRALSQYGEPVALKRKGTEVATIAPEASIKRAADWLRAKNVGEDAFNVHGRVSSPYSRLGALAVVDATQKCSFILASSSNRHIILCFCLRTGIISYNDINEQLRLWWESAAV
jgi:CBS domain-containing protein